MCWKFLVSSTWSCARARYLLLTDSVTKTVRRWLSKVVELHYLDNQSPNHNVRTRTNLHHQIVRLARTLACFGNRTSTSDGSSEKVISNSITYVPDFDWSAPIDTSYRSRLDSLILFWDACISKRNVLWERRSLTGPICLQSNPWQSQRRWRNESSTSAMQYSKCRRGVKKQKTKTLWVRGRSEETKIFLRRCRYAIRDVDRFRVKESPQEAGLSVGSFVCLSVGWRLLSDLWIGLSGRGAFISWIWSWSRTRFSKSIRVKSNKMGHFDEHRKNSKERREGSQHTDDFDRWKGRVKIRVDVPAVAGSEKSGEAKRQKRSMGAAE